MHPDLRITDDAISIRLLKTAPGLESDVYSNLTTALSADKAQVLLGFGDYDLLVIARGNGGPLEHSNTGAIPYILGAREVVCFGVEQRSDPTPRPDLMEVLAKRNVFSLTFVRVPGFFTHRDNARPEQAFLDWWWKRPVDQNPASDQVLLGTLGGPEFVIVHAGDSLESVHRWIESGPAVHPTVAKSFSLVAVSGSVLAPADERRALGRCYRGLNMELRVSCRPLHAKILARHLTNLVAAAQAEPREDHCIEVSRRALVTGMEDFVFSLNASADFPLRELIEIVLRFRRECRQLLLGTAVCFRHDHADEAWSTPGVPSVEEAVAALQPQVVTPPRLSLTAAQSAQISALPEVGPVVVRALYQFGNIMQNPLLSNDLIDLFNYFQSFKRQALNTPRDDIKARTELADRLTPAHHGVDQRTIGANEGVNPVESNVRHLLGGTQKIMQAAESIPLSVFEQYNNSLWQGFVVFGMYQEFNSNEYLALTLPLNCMWEPSRWVWLLHESAHALLCNDGGAHSPHESLFEATSDAICAEADRFRGEMPADRLRELAMEVLTDLIELNFGPQWIPELMLYSRWHYYTNTFRLADLKMDSAYSLTLRSLFALACLQATGVARGADSSPPDDFGPLERLWEDTYTKWSTMARAMTAMHERLEMRKLRELVELFWPLREIAAATVPFDREALAARRGWWDNVANEQIKKVAAGMPVQAEDVKYPELFVWKLMEFSRQHDGMSIPQRTVAILGLHDWYRTTWTRRRDIALAAVRKKYP